MRIVPNTYNSYNYQLNLQNTNRRQTSNFLQMVGPNATDQVKETWKKAEQEVGANGFALASDGKFTQLTELMGMSLVKYHQTGNMDILGDTNSSARQAVQEALDRLKQNGVSTDEELKEKAFYESFLKYLS